MFTTAVLDGSSVTGLSTYCTPLLRCRIGITVTGSVFTLFPRYSVALKFASVIQNPPTSACADAGLSQLLFRGSRGATGLCGASTLGCCAGVVWLNAPNTTEITANQRTSDIAVERLVTSDSPALP